MMPQNFSTIRSRFAPLVWTALALCVATAFAWSRISHAAPLPSPAASELFGRLIGRATSTESMTVARQLMRVSPELRQFSRGILGADAAGVADESLTEHAIRKLQRQGDFRLARELEKRLAAAEDDFVFRMKAHPQGDVDAVLAKLSAERFQIRAEIGGKPVRFKEAALSDSERALAQALKVDPKMGALRAEVNAAAIEAPQILPTLEAYEAILAKRPDLEAFFTRHETYAQLADLEMSEFTSRLTTVLAEIEKAPAAMDTVQRVSRALRKTLRGNVPARQIQERVAAFLRREPGSLARALGDMSLAETRELFFGLDPLHPSADSLLGQYLKETGATTMVRTFDDAAAVEAGKAAGSQGPQKLVVSFSEASFPVFMKYFKRKEWMSVFNHALMVHDGITTSYDRTASAMRVPGTEYTPFPVLLLKPTEGQRAAQYFKLFRAEQGKTVNSWDAPGSAPWHLDNYCARSSWAGGCTQHIGNIPIGDARVIEYTVPGGPQWGGPLNPPPVVQRLRPYVSNDPLTQRVWKVPGNQMLGETIGQQAAYLRGELANPGWVIWTLMGPTTVERVPVIFVSRPDHRAPIVEGFRPNVEGRG